MEAGRPSPMSMISAAWHVQRDKCSAEAGWPEPQGHEGWQLQVEGTLTGSKSSSGLFTCVMDYQVEEEEGKNPQKKTLTCSVGAPVVFLGLPSKGQGFTPL